MTEHQRRSPQLQAERPGDQKTPIIRIFDERYVIEEAHSPRDGTIQAHPSTVVETPMDLNGLLRQGACTHADKQLFWPESILKQIVTPDRIVDQLVISGSTRDAAEPLAKLIASDYLKVFAILILMGKQRDIHKLASDKITDDTLPLQQLDHVQCYIASKGALLSCFNHWTESEREDFIRRQNRVSPVFPDLEPDRRSIKNVTYGDDVVLPFLEEHPVQIGGYGAVSKVIMPREGHGFHDILRSIVTNDVFAVKRLLGSDEQLSKKQKEHRKEVEALKRFSGFVHDHLVTLLMTWTIKGSMKDHYNLLFPWADRDLDSYWEHTEYPSIGVNPDRAAIQWVAKQIVGMAGALATIHNPRYDNTHLTPKQKYGRHGDIKPENILWYPSPRDPKGILVVADLGLTAFNGTNSRSNVPNQGIPASPGYRPPECDLEKGKISQAFDIWTFGCLLLEMVCWALGGQTNRVDFEKHRDTPYITNCKTDIFFDVLFKGEGRGYAIMVKAKVSEWISRLHGRPLCTQFFHELLDLIEESMIIVISPGHERIRSAPLLKKLEDMCQRVNAPTDPYCQYPCPERRLPRICVPVDAYLNEVATGLVKDRKPALGTHHGQTRSSKTLDDFEKME